MPLIFVFLTFAVFAYVLGNINFSDYLLVNYINGSGEIVIFCTSAIGALLGFLWFNSSPASIFMGDTGSQSLGASLAVTSILLKQEIVLAVAGGLFVIETLSVMIQVTYFRLSKGKRVFLMAPLHHHYEKKGLSEQKIVIRFWILSFLFLFVSFITFKNKIIDKFKKKFLIYGYGVSGKSIEKYLINNNCNYNIYDDFKKIISKKVISKKYLENKINQYNYFVVSPSIKIGKKSFFI